MYGRRQMNELKKIDTNVSSYQYLKLVDQLLKEQISKNIRLSRIFYPASFIAACLIIWFSDGRVQIMERFLAKYPEQYMIAGVPMYFIVGMLLVTLLMVLFADKIYKWDIRIICGRADEKLEEIIADLEELRA